MAPRPPPLAGPAPHAGTRALAPHATQWTIGTEQPAVVTLEVPTDAVAVEAPPLDLSAAPGAVVAVLQRWSLAEGPMLEVGCATGPTDRWVDGLQPAVLDAASTLARARWSWASLTPEAASTERGYLVQAFAAGPSGQAPTAVGRHAFAFWGEGPEIVVCTVVCSGQGATAPPCRGLVDSLSLHHLADPPAPGVGGHLLAWLARPSAPGAALALLASVLLVAAVLRRRPRPSW